VGIIAELNRQIAEQETGLTDHFEAHPDADIYLSPDSVSCSAPGCSVSSGTTRTGTTTAKSRKNYAGTSARTVASGNKRAVLARLLNCGNWRSAALRAVSVYANMLRC
jgi:hypothetical protein